MKIYTLNILILAIFLSLPMLCVAGTAFPTSSQASQSKSLSKKELRKEKRTKKLRGFIQKRIEKRLEKIQKKRKYESFSDLDRNLQLAILFGLVAILLVALSTFISFLFVLSAIAWVAGVIFLVLWLVENV